MTARDHPHGSADEHAHDHPHPHERAVSSAPESQYLGPSNDGSVMLDIGGDIGALVLVTPGDLVGAEIEVSRVDAPEPRTHVAIRERRGPAGTRYAGIYPSLRAGQYIVWRPDGTPADTVTVVGGEVAQVEWI